ncbi:hypothetical protein IG631_22808 [Alternaria alternata]|nr:hypothetical protein IG631_22808 [Alternaria alternata]
MMRTGISAIRRPGDPGRGLDRSCVPRPLTRNLRFESCATSEPRVYRKMMQTHPDRVEIPAFDHLSR